ncbi:Transcription factor Adf-1 [Chionoecetes opilio]|uniref:Transcription factor Adf-1 n=1 Tax=Chionoecetes opilio TaxID=41210 RepID=A0A8J5CJ76_CHIOP|nr:Transcription factor Adf-1 [Chionoecetes opilio]
MVVINIEQLIAEVYNTPAIWNSSHSKHNDRMHISRQWRRIGDSLRVTEESAKKKFKNLRDQFRLELKKVPQGRDGDPTLTVEEHLSIWPWFKQMFFLKDRIKRTVGKTPSASVTGVAINRNSEEESNQSLPSDAYQSLPSDAFGEANHVQQESQEDPLNIEGLDVHLTEAPSPVNCLKRMRESTLQSDYLAVEIQRMEMLKRQSDDERDSDRQFLLSLLPAIKALHPRRSQQFRLRVQQLLYDAQYSHAFDK